jgi:menaquinone-dependent protoporphyrinogen oxidase
MKIKVLLAYASTHGSTQEIATAIAATLTERGLVVDLRPVREVRTLEGYQAVVLGAPLYMFHLHKDALRFLSQQRKALTAGLPIAIFAGGPISIEEGNEWQEARKQLDQELAKFPWLRPVSIEIVGGKHTPANLSFPWNLIPALKQMPASDLRDWVEIRAWAESLAVQFQPVPSP